MEKITTNLCRLCNSTNLEKCFDAKILGKYQTTFYLCNNCSLLQPINPNIWLKESYKNSINISDTGLLSRNLVFVNKLCSLIFLIFGYKNLSNLKFLDYGAGYGILVRLMRDIGFNFFWQDEYSDNLLARGFEMKHNHFYEACTLLEVMEHLLYPLEEVKEIIKKTNMIIFTTTLYGSMPPNPNKWSYYGLSHGQHISLYSKKTLKWIANELSLFLYTDNRSLHILSKKKLSRHIILIHKLFTKFSIGKIIFQIFLKSQTLTDHNNLKVNNN